MAHITLLKTCKYIIKTVKTNIYFGHGYILYNNYLLQKRSSKHTRENNILKRINIESTMCRGMAEI